MDETNQLHISPHSLTKEQVLSELKVSIENGLSDADVATRRAKYGENTLPQETSVSSFRILLRQFKSLMVLILSVAAGLSWLLGHSIDSIVIVILILVNVVIGFYQEFQAEKAVRSLKKLVETKTKVRRNGRVISLLPNELVPGDIVILETGDKITADGRVVISQSLRTTEASLTGDSYPIDKHTEPVSQDALIGDRRNMVYMGTLVIGGGGEIVVSFTGTQTQLGQIAKKIEGIQDVQTHYERKTGQLSKVMGGIAIFSAAVTFVVGYFWRQFGLYEMISFTTATLVSALPESLPIILVIVLAIGAQRMAKQKAIVRRLAATETLGVVSVIITDKTGTLTMNQMNARQLQFFGQDPVVVEDTAENVSMGERRSLTRIISEFCHSVREDESGKPFGDPTEVAVYLFGKKVRAGKTEVLNAKKIDDMPFVQELRLRASLISLPGKNHNLLCVIGAPESTVEKCDRIITDGGKVGKITVNSKKDISGQYEEMTSQGMRVLAMAYKEVPKAYEKISASDLKGLTYLGILGLIDPPRPEVKEAIKTAHQAGIRVIMATGDHPLTAEAVARDINLIGNGDTGQIVLSEKNIVSMDDAELLDALKSVIVFARLTPASKLRIASLLQSQGEIVAMTGDGVNDAPALKQADVGVSMGKVGTDVAREASDIVLADDNFASIISAIREGRTQFGNVRRTSGFLIITNVAESASILITLFVGYPLPLLPLQILWLNIITGGVTDFALATEQSHDDMMKVAPRDPKENIFTWRIMPLFLTIVVSMIIMVMGVFVYYLPFGIEKARTAVFVILSVTQLLNMFNLRVLHRPVVSIGLFSNKVINKAFVVSLVLGLMVLYLPVLQNVFGFIPLSLTEVLVLSGMSMAVFVMAEVVKIFFPAGSVYRPGSDQGLAVK